VLQGQVVKYWLRRGQRKTIGFSVGPQGLSVSAPRWTLLSAIDAALQTKADWVLRKLAQVGQRHEVLEAARVDWADGTTVAWLGGSLTVRVGLCPGAAAGAPPVPHRRGTPMVQRQAPHAGADAPDTLWVALPATATGSQLRDAVQAWMMQAAHAHFVQRLNHFAPLLAVRWTVLKLSAATTRWGSAKADGSIRLHWRLMQFAPAVVDYVVAHELAHLRHMDHSDRFWQTVASVVPDYAALRARLKGERLPPW
jgi:predicted metal-dependent hydrolase